jgi:hypothetical protein
MTPGLVAVGDFERCKACRQLEKSALGIIILHNSIMSV